eukprot:UN03286
MSLSRNCLGADFQITTEVVATAGAAVSRTKSADISRNQQKPTENSTTQQTNNRQQRKTAPECRVLITFERKVTEQSNLLTSKSSFDRKI